MGSQVLVTNAAGRSRQEAEKRNEVSVLVMPLPVRGNPLNARIGPGPAEFWVGPSQQTLPRIRQALSDLQLGKSAKTIGEREQQLKGMTSGALADWRCEGRRPLCRGGIFGQKITGS